MMHRHSSLSPVVRRLPRAGVSALGQISAFHFPTRSWTRSRRYYRCLAHPTTNSHIPSHSTATRLFSTTEKTSQESSTNEEDEHLLDPYDMIRNLQKESNSEDTPKIPLPTHLSPTSLEQFHKCPQAFFFRYILKLTPDPPTTPQLARGIICHTALEEVFELKPEDRSLINLENLFRREWGRVRGNRDNGDDETKDDNTDDAPTNKKENQYDILFREESEDGTNLGPYDIAEEIKWGESSLALLRNYYHDLEDPRTVQSPNPVTREMWVQAKFPTGNNDSTDDDEFIVRGKIDRIDILPTSPSDDKVQLQIIDYKTGKKPWFKYSQSVNDRIAKEQFWKMKVYALILWKMILETDKASSQGGYQKEQYKYGMSYDLKQRLLQTLEYTQQHPQWSDILQLHSLRLMYLTSNIEDDSANDSTTVMTNDKVSIGKAKNLDLSLGSTPSEFQSMLDETEHEVKVIARNLKLLVDYQDPHAFEHCDWGYCSCHELRRKFRRGSVYQNPDMYD